VSGYQPLNCLSLKERERERKRERRMESRDREREKWSKRAREKDGVEREGRKESRKCVLQWVVAVGCSSVL